MITPAAQVKVLDFGLAKFAAIDSGEGQDETRAWLTAPHVVMGTAAYMSPEQSIGGVVDRRSDLFSLGVFLYEAATGRVPFTGATPFEVMDRLRHSEPDSITSLNRVCLTSALFAMTYGCQSPKGTHGGRARSYKVL